jgi:hypothetical protein
MATFNTIRPVCDLEGLHVRTNKSLWVARSKDESAPTYVYPADADEKDVRKSYIRDTNTKYDDARLARLRSFERKAA